VHGIGHGGDHRQERSLAGFLGAEGALGIVGLDQDGVDLGRLERGRALVFEQRRDLVHALSEYLLLHQHLAEPHVHGALDLSFHEERIERAADVVGDPDLEGLDVARVRVHLDLDHAGRIRVAGRGPDSAALVLPRPLRRRVGAGKGEHAVHALAEGHRLREGHASIGIVGHEDAASARLEPIRRHLELPRRRREDLLPESRRRLDGRIARHQRHPRGVRAEIDRREIGVRGMDADVHGLDTQHLGD